ncbi:MAG: ATP-binding cassette domain-containing protein, partial [Sediminispirochaetaceae bacterium]
MSESTPALAMEARDITKVFPGTTALQNVSFKIYRGKINVLVGENGAGKSTLRKIIAGIEQPTVGTLHMYGEDGAAEAVSFPSTREAAKKGIGIVHQELNLFTDLDVAENIFMNKELKKFGSAFIDHNQQAEKARAVLK